MFFTGIDLIEIDRFERALQRHGKRFLERIFTLQELHEVGGNIPSLAARFAAKEAVAKALGTGIGDVGWCEIEVLRGPNRKPALLLHGSAQYLASELNLRHWSLSLSHTRLHAIAMVIAFREEAG